ncbi:MAG: M28 family peptidase [Pyrinomonadaceae bacterium]
MIKKVLVAILSILFVLCLAVGEALACTTFCLRGPGEVFFGRNYDFAIGDALIFVNKRGLSKTATDGDSRNPAKWIARYGSVTFNQFGRENPTGGMNEMGLVVEQMWLDETEYPKDDMRPTLGSQEWIQFLLDTSVTTSEAITKAEGVRIVSDVKVHYLLSDKNGAVATIEFVKGKMVVHTGDNLTVATLTNDTYEKSINYKRMSSIEKDTSASSLHRFTRAAQKTEQFGTQPKSEQDAVNYAFEMLANVTIKDYTRWSIVYDQKRGKVYFRTLRSPQIKMIDTRGFDYSCASPVKILDMDVKEPGDATSGFIDYTRKANRDLIERSFNGTDFLKGIPVGARDFFAAYSESFTCTSTQRDEAELPTVDQILEKYIRAIGGKEAVQAQTSRVMKGTITAPTVGGKGTIEIYAKAPNKQLTETSLNILGNSRTGFNGTVAWEEEQGKVKESSGFSKRDADFYLPIKLKELYPRIDLKGTEKMGEREAYLLEAPRGGNPKRWYFDVKTGVLLRMEVRNAAGKVMSREDYQDYRAVGGVQYAFTVQAIDDNEVPFTINYTVIRLNVAIDDVKFDKPAAKPPLARLSSTEQEAAAQLKTGTIREVTSVLASKEMEGRGTAQAGGDRAAKYLADRFARAGLKPAGEGATFLQRIKFVIDTPFSETSFSVGGAPFEFRRDFAILDPLPSPTKDINAPMVFVGYGVVSDELKRDDLAGIDVKGKIAVLLGGKPAGVDAAIWQKLRTDEVLFERLANRGAVGSVFIWQDTRGSLPFSAMASAYSRRRVRLAGVPQTSYGNAPILFVGDTVAERILGSPGRTFAQLRQIAESGRFISRNLDLRASISLRIKHEEGVGSNVIGVIEGADPKLKTEAVVYSAHYDAFGLDTDGTIYPGAADNALGVGKLLALAEVFGKMTPRPRRSIIFSAWTGEEYGDLGSKHWLQHPTWPLEQVAANINYDGIGTDVWGKLAFILDLNFDQSDLNGVVKGVAAASGVEIVPDSSEEEVFYRSDHYDFIKSGIPGLFLIGGPGEDITERAQKFLTTDYHMPTDIVQPDWNWEGARMLAAFGLITGMRIANQEAMPAWKTDSPYKRPREARTSTR